MATASWTRHTADVALRSTVRRERVSIDLRGHGLALTAVAQSKGVPVAVLVRSVLAEWLQTSAVAESGVRSAPDVALEQHAGAVIKVTLRMRAGHAARLARAARAAEHSQGAYVERLMDELPLVPVSPDLRESRAARTRSISTLAPMSGEGRRYENLWQRKAREEGRLRHEADPTKSGDAYRRKRIGALLAWARIMEALNASDQAGDRELALHIRSFVRDSTFVKEYRRQKAREVPAYPHEHDVSPVVARERSGPDIER